MATRAAKDRLIIYETSMVQISWAWFRLVHNRDYCGTRLLVFSTGFKQLASLSTSGEFHVRCDLESLENSAHTPKELLLTDSGLAKLCYLWQCCWPNPRGGGLAEDPCFLLSLACTLRFDLSWIFFEGRETHFLGRRDSNNFGSPVPPSVCPPPEQLLQICSDFKFYESGSDAKDFSRPELDAQHVLHRVAHSRLVGNYVAGVILDKKPTFLPAASLGQVFSCSSINMRSVDCLAKSRCTRFVASSGDNNFGKNYAQLQANRSTLYS